jgi:probable HAF family extracellular repeat protein
MSELALFPPPEHSMRNIPYVILIAALAGCGDDAKVTQPTEALSHQDSSPQYRIIKFASTLGGTSRGSDINDQGWVAGFSNLTDGTRHATLWRHGSLIDLRTLEGPHSSVQWHGLNSGGMVVGIAETAETDSLNEAWSCSAFFPSATGNVCRGFVWEGGVMTALPTLGGTHGYAASVNNQGQIVGWAETPVHDPTCESPTQVLQFRAVLWEPKQNRQTELPPFPGDSTSAATAINERGQVVGISGECDIAVGRFSARHAVLWEDGKVTDLTNLGGTTWHTPTAINNLGDIVGFSNPAVPGDLAGEFLVRAFLWTRGGGMQSLGRLPGDSTSQARGINSRRQVVGVSTSFEGISRAFLWDGTMRNLNELVEPGFADSLVAAQDINEAGHITGTLVELSTGKTLPFVAVPKE